jgi:hypothetical protein
VAELVPEIAESKRIIIVTDDEKAMTNAVFKTWPKIPLFRCWIHAWQNIKNQLRKCNIRDKVSVSHYKSDFIKLLLQRSEKSRKIAKNLTSRCLLDFIFTWMGQGN